MARHEAAGKHAKAPKAPRPKNKKARKVVAIVLVCALALGGVGVGIFQFLRGRGGAVSVYPVRSGLSAEPDMYSQNQTDGQVTTDRMQSVYLSSTQTVTEVFVTEGQEVHAGDRILSFDTTLTEVQLEKARINVEQTKMDLQDAEDMLREIATYRVGSPGGFEPEETPEPSPAPPDPPGFQFGRGTLEEPYVFLWRDGMLLNETTMDALAQIAYNANYPDHDTSDEPELPPSPGVTTPEGPTETAPPDALRPVAAARPAVQPLVARSRAQEPVPIAAEPESPTESGAPKTTPVPEVTPEPEVTSAPETTAEPGATQQPEISPDPVITPEPGITPIPETTPEPAGSTEPAITSEPQITPEPGASASPTPEPSVTPSSTPSPTPSPTPTAEASEEPSGEMKPDCEYYMVFEIRMENSLARDIQRAFEVHFWREDGIFCFEVMEPAYTPVFVEPDENHGDDFFFDNTQYYSADEIAKMKRETESQILELQIDLKLAEQDLKEKEYEVSNGEVLCEVDGTVKTLLSADEAVSTGEPMVVVSGGGGYIVRGAMGEFDLNTLHVGDTVQVMDWRSGDTYDGTITEISPYPADSNQYYYYSSNGNRNVTAYPFTVSVSEDAALRENYSVTIYLPFGGEQGSEDNVYLASPLIRSEGGRRYIYVERDGVLKKQYVTTGQNLWGSYLEIQGGLTQDDYVAFPYGRNVKDGAEAVKEEDISKLYE